jgi:hypothetical protein
MLYNYGGGGGGEEGYATVYLPITLPDRMETVLPATNQIFFGAKRWTEREKIYGR